MAPLLHLAFLLAFIQAGLALPEQQQQPLIAAPTSSHTYAPAEENAIKNAPHVFNAIHSAMRQWVCSLMSFYGLHKIESEANLSFAL